MAWKVYAQRNVPGLAPVPWAGQRLGTCNGITLGSDGCYTTAEAQVLTHYEHVINPGQWDDVKTNRGLYYQGCQTVDGRIQNIDPDVRYVETKDWALVAADLNYLHMADDEEIIIGLDNLNQGAKSRHFARVYDYNPATGVLLIDDPWWGVTLNFATKYGSPSRNVIKAVKYRIPGWKPPWKRVVTPPVVTPPIVVTPPVVVADPLADELKQQLAASVALLKSTSEQLATTTTDRDLYKAAYTTLDTTFAQVRATIPK